MLSHWEFYILVPLKGSGSLNQRMVSINLLAEVSVQLRGGFQVQSEYSRLWTPLLKEACEGLNER